MFELNLPTYPYKITLKNKKHYIFDVIRKKNIFLTPEEWVRQHFIHYLINDKKYPKSLIAIEKEIKVNGLSKRFDILVFNSKGKHQIIVECKAPKVKITQATFDQIARYNMTLNAKFLIVTNGLEHFYCQMDAENKTYLFLEECPIFNKKGKD